MHNAWFSACSAARRGKSLVLAVSWIGGLLCGILCYSVSPGEINSLVHRAVFCSASIVGLLNATLIPFLLSILLIFLSKSWIVVAVCFAKAFLFSYVSIGCLLNLGSGGWLFRYFLLFSDCTVLPFVYLSWLHGIASSIRLRWVVTCAILICVLVLVTFLDYRFLAPFVCLIDSTKG